MSDWLAEVETRWVDGTLGYADYAAQGAAAAGKADVDRLVAEIKQLRGRITRALDFAGTGQVDGEHHKAWAIDQMVRALLGSPIVTRTATDHRGWSYDYEAQGESKEYRRFVDEWRAGEDGPDTYSWDEGIPP